MTPMWAGVFAIVVALSFALCLAAIVLQPPDLKLPSLRITVVWEATPEARETGPLSFWPRHVRTCQGAGAEASSSAGGRGRQNQQCKKSARKSSHALFMPMAGKPSKCVTTPIASSMPRTTWHKSAAILPPRISEHNPGSSFART